MPVAILPSGTMTTPLSFARAAYAAALAAVLPVDAQMTACAPSRALLAETAQVIPRSLNEPVGFAPSIFSHTCTPRRSPSASAGTSGVEPSCRLTTGSSGANGRRSR